MPRRKKEPAISKLREIEVEVRRGETVAEAVKKIGVTEQTYLRWTAYSDADERRRSQAAPATSPIKPRFKKRMLL